MANSWVTREHLTCLKDAAIACTQAAGELSASCSGEIRLACERGDVARAAEAVETRLRDAIDRWEQWGELFTTDAKAFLQLHNADRADPVQVKGTAYATATEAAGALLEPFLATFATLVDAKDRTDDEADAVAKAAKAGNAATWRCCAKLAAERVKRDVDFADRLIALSSEATRGVDVSALKFAVVSEWAQASRGIFNGKTPTTLEEVCTGLTNDMERMVRFLWGRRYPTKWDALKEACWSGGEGAGSEIREQLQQVTERLLENSITDVFLDVDVERRSVKLVRPRLIDE